MPIYEKLRWGFVAGFTREELKNRDRKLSIRDQKYVQRAYKLED